MLFNYSPLSITVALPVLLVSAFVLVFTNRRLRYTANDAISATINIYLMWRYPIYHQDAGREIPTCPYRFPNGQGDVGKFLQGMENSEKWESSYGAVYRIWSGMRPEIVLARPEHLQAVFKDSDKHTKAINNNSGYLMSQLLGQCVGLISGREWKTLRGAMEKPFLRKTAAEYVPLVEKHVSGHLHSLLQNGQLAEGLLDPAEDTKLLPFWIVSEIFYGELSSDLTEELRDLVPVREGLFKHVIAGGLSRFSFSRHLPTKATRSFADFQARWRCFNDKAYRYAKAVDLGESQPPIVQLYELVSAGVITSEQLLQTLDEAIFANLDVTTGGISWNLVFLAAYPGYQELLSAEMTRHASPEERRKYILGNSTLLAACIAESSRLKPLAAFSVPQSAPTDRWVDGYRIPAGTDFIVDSYGLNTRSGFWGPDAAMYRPQRFLEKGALEMRYHFWRFGFGPRQCMGKYVADIMIRTLMVHLIENYRLSLLDTKEWGRNPEMWINHPRMQIRCVEKRTG